MRRLFLLIDEILRRRQKIEEFSDDPDCVLRIKRCLAPRELARIAAEIPAGADVLELHLWNEHLPQGSPSGPGLSWAVKGRGAFVRSLERLAAHIDRRADLREVEAVFGVTTFMSERDARTAERVLGRLGFSQAPYRSSLGAFGDFWENLHVWFLYRTFRRGGRRKPLFGLRRRILWMSKQDLLRRYARHGVRAERRQGAAHATSAAADMAWRSIS